MRGRRRLCPPAVDEAAERGIAGGSQRVRAGTVQKGSPPPPPRVGGALS